MRPATAPTGGRGDCCNILRVEERPFRGTGPDGRLGLELGGGRLRLGLCKRGLGPRVRSGG